jgi:hypothetical protein
MYVRKYDICECKSQKIGKEGFDCIWSAENGQMVGCEKLQT